MSVDDAVRAEAERLGYRPGEFLDDHRAIVEAAAPFIRAPLEAENAACVQSATRAQAHYDRARREVERLEAENERLREDVADWRNAAEVNGQAAQDRARERDEARDQALRDVVETLRAWKAYVLPTRMSDGVIDAADHIERLHREGKL